MSVEPTNMCRHQDHCTWEAAEGCYYNQLAGGHKNCDHRSGLDF